MRFYKVCGGPGSVLILGERGRYCCTAVKEQNMFVNTAYLVHLQLRTYCIALKDADTYTKQKKCFEGV